MVTFVTGGDPNLETSKKIIKTLAKNGADIIEIGMPFSDPMADGPTIQLASSRAIKKGVDLKKIFSICNNFRLSCVTKKECYRPFIKLLLGESRL